LENRYVIIYDLKQKSFSYNIKFKQHDINTSVLEVHFENNSETVDITGETFEFRFLKPGNIIISQNSSTGVTIKDNINGIVECILCSDTLDTSGILLCDIRRTISNRILTTLSFSINVEAIIE